MTAETAAQRAVTFLPSDKQRFAVVTLEWPLDIDGEPLTEIYVHRMTAQQVAEVVKAATEAGDSETVSFPMFRDAAGNLLGQDVLDALDDDDYTAVSKVMADFLPRRFRAAPDTATTPPNGSAIAR